MWVNNLLARPASDFYSGDELNMYAWLIALAPAVEKDLGDRRLDFKKELNEA